MSCILSKQRSGSAAQTQCLVISRLSRSGRRSSLPSLRSRIFARGYWPVGKCPVEDLDDERELQQETREQACSKTRGIGIGCPVFDEGRLLSGSGTSRKERRCGELRVWTSGLGHRLTLTLYRMRCVQSAILIQVSGFG
jgi:hypothetical protein